MKDLQQLWDEIPETGLNKDDIKGIINRKSNSELNTFRRILITELIATTLLIIPIYFLINSVNKDFMRVIFTTVFLGYSLNVLTLIKLKEVRLISDVKTYLKSILKFLRTFVFRYIALLLIVEILVIVTLKTALNADNAWIDWFISKDGMITLSIVLLTMVALLIYARVFYVSRIRSIEKLLGEIEG
ncbi:MAG: hypothetical protein JXR03_18810 [Cyclobacteriaceae bacterium]